MHWSATSSTVTLSSTARMQSAFRNCLAANCWKRKLHSAKLRCQFSKYEKVCTDALKLLFSDYLSIWEEQQKSNDDLYRFDLICKIKNDVNDDFFSTIKQLFLIQNTLFLTSKNYTEQITSKRNIYNRKNTFMIKL